MFFTPIQFVVEAPFPGLGFLQSVDAMNNLNNNNIGHHHHHQFRNQSNMVPPPQNQMLRATRTISMLTFKSIEAAAAKKNIIIHEKLLSIRFLLLKIQLFLQI